MNEKMISGALSQEVHNILAVYLSATAAEISAGIAWYPVAKQDSEFLAARYGVSVEVVAGVISAFSPNTPWKQNVINAENALIAYREGTPILDWRNPKSGNGIGMGGMRVKAQRILDGEDIVTVLNGNKTVTFYLNILGRQDIVCVDGHATNIAMFGLVRQTITKAKKPTDKQYRNFEQDYIKAADIMGITPSVMQAVTWVAYKRFLTPTQEVNAAKKTGKKTKAVALTQAAD